VGARLVVLGERKPILVGGRTYTRSAVHGRSSGDCGPSSAAWIGDGLKKRSEGADHVDEALRRLKSADTVWHSS
jgi:hypothetical protein